MRTTREEIRVTLSQSSGREHNDANLSWEVTAVATVRNYGGSRNEPDELLIEDIEIETLHWTMLTVGMMTRRIPDDVDMYRQGLHEAQQIDWLNSQMDDRDDWREQIEVAVVREANKELAAA
jgi:hypothetical protein